MLPRRTRVCVEWWYEMNAKRSGEHVVGGPGVSNRQLLSQTTRGCGYWDGMEGDGIKHCFDGLW